MTTEELERQVRKNTIAIKTVSDSLVNYVQNQQLTSTNKVTAANTSDIDKLKNDLNSIQTQINLQNRIELMKDTNIVDPTKLDLLQYDGDRWSNIAASKVVTGLLGRLTDLQDVEIKNLRNDNALAWDSELQKWTNKNLNTELYDDIYISKIKPDSTPYEVWFKDSAILVKKDLLQVLLVLVVRLISLVTLSLIALLYVDSQKYQSYVIIVQRFSQEINGMPLVQV